MSVFVMLARHGETADNARRVFQGQGGSGLNRLGRAQAARLAERVRRDPPRAIFASDLDRAVETARIVAQACGLPLSIDPGLREVDVGAWTGKGYDEISRLFPEEWAAWESGVDVRRGGGETYAELAARIDATLARIAESLECAPHMTERSERSEHLTALVVSHGGSIKSWIAKILGVSADGLYALGGVANAGLSVVERIGPPTRARHRLHSWNDVAHLEGLVAEEHSD